MRRALLAVLLLCSGCGGMFLYPSSVKVQDPSQYGLRYSEVFLDTPGGDRLAAWRLHAEHPRGTILYLHGNAENISTFLSAVQWLPARGYDVFMLEYRGYGPSEGEATLDNLHEDAALAIDHLLADGARPLILFGHSLGGAIALEAAAAHPRGRELRAVVADSAFSGYRRIAREKLASGWLTWPLQWPLSLLFPDDRSPERAIARLAPVRVLLIHGEADEVVPYSHALRLAAAAPATELWTVPGGRHIDALTRPGYRDRLVAWLDARSATKSKESKGETR